MINLGLDAASLAAYHNLLKSSHVVKVTVYLMSPWETEVVDISDRLLEGAVDIDAQAAITRSAKITVADPNSELGLDGPQVGGTGAAKLIRRFMRIYYGVAPIDNPAAMIHCCIFTGPVTGVDRDGVTLVIDGLGKEVIAKDGAFRAITFPAGWIKAQAHSYWLYNLVGENYVAHVSAKPWILFSQPWYLEAGTDVWQEVKDLMYGQGLHSYYNSAGTAMLTDWPTQAVFGFDESWLTSVVKPVYDYSQIVNAVRVTGAMLDGIGRYEAEAVLPWDHPLSWYQASLRGDVPRYIAEFINDDTIVDPYSAQAVANQVLQDRTLIALNVNFSSFVLPTVEENDIYIVSSRNFYGQARMVKATIPLVGDAEMSVGFLSTSSTLYAASVTGSTRFQVTPEGQALIEENKRKLLEASIASNKAKASDARSNSWYGPAGPGGLYQSALHGAQAANAQAAKDKKKNKNKKNPPKKGKH